jgi:hypothetical protein
MLNKALEMSVCFHTGPFLGNIGGRSFPRAFERRVKFLLSGEFYEEFERRVKTAMETSNSLRRGRRWGTWRGFV